MAATQFPLQPPSASPRHPIDLKANGEVSRMRSHRGNMPSLPQTKYCSLCPAKFTRTTHLNRHLRSHTNERLHRCNICSAEFTRSDLLTRHKRTCGDPQNANRSRRKSCQACAESKIKCDLQYPCSKCSSRGRECIFINDPEASRIKKLAAAKKAAQRLATPKSGSDKGQAGILLTPGSSIFPSLPSTPSQAYSTYTPSHDPTSLPPQLTMVHQSGSLTGYETPQYSSSSASSSASSTSSPRSEFYEASQDVTSVFDIGLDALTLDTHLNKLFSTTTFEPFLDHSLIPQDNLSTIQTDFGWLETQDFFSSYTGISDDSYSFPPLSAEQQYITTSDYSRAPSSTTSPSVPIPDLPAFGSAPSPANTESSVITTSSQPPSAELQHYLYLFFSAFSAQVPLLHPSTWRMEGKPPILIRAMQACGALFVKTRTALNFINETLTSTRDILIQEFAKHSTDSTEHTNLILAVVLLQTIGLFHQRADQRVSSNVYHGMLVMMIRRTGLINRIASWVPPDLSDLNSLESAWSEWTMYESIKRALFLSYLHDCCHCMYFSLSPSFQHTEFDINLPCDDNMWKASSAQEWFEALQRPSPYGMGHTRIMGVGMQHALATLTDVQHSAPLALNPFGHFILIHSILRNLYAFRAENQSTNSVTSPISPYSPSNGADGTTDIVVHTQYALQAWLQSWLNGPETMTLEKSRDEPPFIYNALPFYWLAQISLVAMQEGTGSLNAKALNAMAEGRFRLMKQWLEHIRTFLRRGDQIPAHLWDELMKIQIRITQSEGDGQDGQDGLLAFFPDN